MTKAELIEALKDFPDDMIVKIPDDYDFWKIKEVEEMTVDHIFGQEKIILLRY